MVDDLTDVLDCGEATDMDEDVRGPAEDTSPIGRWTTTSTCDVYMVDTPNTPPRRRRRRGRGNNGEPSGNNATADNDDVEAGDADNPKGDHQASLGWKGTPEGHLEDSNRDDLFEGGNDNYMPESEDDESLSTKDYVVPEYPFEQERHWRRLIATARSMKHKQQQL